MAARSGYLERFVAGAIFGLYMAHLLYYLNPQIEITPWRLVVVTLLYGTTWGVIFGTVLWLARKVRVRLFGAAEEAPRGFGLITASTFISAAVYGMHYLLFRIYLPLGAVRLLLKATVMITLIALLFLMLWVVTSRASPQMSRRAYWSVLLVIAFSAVFLYQRREHYDIDRRSAVVADLGSVSGSSPVIVVAVRGLPYDWIVTMMGESRLPFFEASRKTGYFTRTEPFPSTHPRALTASLVTGKLPYRHGVTGRFAYVTPLNPGAPYLMIPYGVAFRHWGLLPPVQRILSALPTGSAIAFWTAMERAGLRTSTFNWPAAVLSTTAATVAVPDVFFLGGANPAVRLDPAERTRLEARKPGDLPSAIATPLRAIRRERRVPVENAIHADLWAADTALRAASESTRAITTVSLNTLADSERFFLLESNALPPASTNAGEAIRAYVELVDGFLEELARSRPDATLLVVSPAAPRAPMIPDSPVAVVRALAQEQDPGASDGFLLLRGEHIAHTPNPPAVSVVDVVPTLLFASGLPLARDMDGRAALEAFDSEFVRSNLLSFIQTYEAERFVVRRPPSP
ncbi:MAG: alkaline phosphatase family protein [Thermoanaerobaculia bacterium]